MQFNKYKITYVTYVISTITIFCFLLCVDNTLINDIYCSLKKDILTISTFAFGLVFTALTILIGLLDNQKIKRLSKHHYLDKFMFFSKCCLYENFTIMVLYFVLLILKENKFEFLKKMITSVQITLLIGMFGSLFLVTKDIIWIMKILFKREETVLKESANDIIENNK